jgi:Lipopolysaccharide kinase (Kdo/WaaP) family
MMTQLLQEATPPDAAAPAAGSLGSFWQRWTRGVRHFCARADWDPMAGSDWRERILDVRVTDDFHEKQGRSTGRWILQQNGRRLSVYLKRHYRLPWWHGVLAALWPRGAWSPGMRERRNLLEAAAQGAPVPSVVAAGEWIGPHGKLQSFLAIEELVGMLPLHLAIPLAKARLDHCDFTRWKAGLVAEMARLARLLHDRHWCHKDFYLCHFYILREDTGRLPDEWQRRVHMIDFHRLTRHRWTWPFWMLKDLGGLLYSSAVDGVTSRDRWRFWRSYWQAPTQTWRARFWAWCVRLKGAYYHRKNAKRKCGIRT